MAANPQVTATQRLARISLFGSLALVLSYIETMIPLPVTLPGVKLGLANVAVVVALLELDVRAAAAVAVVKVVASGLLFGSPMMLMYSLGGTTENSKADATSAPASVLFWWARPDSNREPKDYESPAPPLSYRPKTPKGVLEDATTCQRGLRLAGCESSFKTHVRAPRA